MKEDFPMASRNHTRDFNHMETLHYEKENVDVELDLISKYALTSIIQLDPSSQEFQASWATTSRLLFINHSRG